MTLFIRPLRNGQITIPVAFRGKLGINQSSLLQINLIDAELRIRPVETTKTVAGSPWVKQLYDSFTPVRKEAKEKHYTEEEINTAIDQAITAVRKKTK